MLSRYRSTLAPKNANITENMGLITFNFFVDTTKVMLEISKSNTITLVVDPDESRSTVGHKNGIFLRTGGPIGLKFFLGILGDALRAHEF